MSAKTLASYIAKRSERGQLKGTSQRVKARADQVFNNAGGAVFKLDKWNILERFLILGSEGGTYYAGEKKLTVANAKNVEACIKESGFDTVDVIVDISETGRAPSNTPALLALAICATTGDTETRGYALAMLPRVARTGTHLFEFTEFVNSIRGWGRLLREGIANWYQRLNADKLAYQIVKYRQRGGWSHRDLLRLSHPNAGDDALRNNVYKYIVKGAEGMTYGDHIPSLIVAFEQAKTADTKTLVKLIKDHNMPWEAIPTEKLNELRVWEALLDNDMPLMAMTRNLGKMTSIGLLTPGSEATVTAVNALTNGEALQKARVHPFKLLVALNQYSQGRGLKGSLSWTPVQQVKNALNEAFYASFGYVEASGKRNLFALDVSGSMHGAYIQNTTISAAQGALAMAMVSMRSEAAGSWKLMGFGSPNFQEITSITAKTKLDDAVTKIRAMNFGATDCSLPMVYALKNGLKFDTFTVYTDNETWAGRVQPFQALSQYREKTGIPARLIVVGMTATPFTIADPKDPGMLDVVGFDTAAPDVISQFSAGKF
jgi:60 kDa SS-A/Ro ribonucleoprotein